MSSTRSTVDDGIRRVVGEFNDAVNRHDVETMLALTSPEMVFEGTSPPDGERLVGHAAVRALWERIFRDSPNARVDTEEMIVVGDRCVVLLSYVFDANRPEEGHVRGVDVIKVRDGLITEKFSYVKG